MRKSIITGVVLLCLVLTGLTACTPGGGGTTTDLVQVTRGDLKITVSGSGNIEIDKDRDMQLTFGVAGRVEKLFVKEGDKVTEGEVLAKLETDTLELAVEQAETNLAGAQTAQSQAELVEIQAETSVAVAQFALDRIKAVNDLEDEITKLQNEIDAATALPGFGMEINWNAIDDVRAQLAQKKQDLGELLGEDAYTGLITYDILSQKYGRWVVDDVRVKELQLKSAQQAVTQAQVSLQQTQNAITLAQKSLSVAQKQLNDATITAPFDGVVASVGVDEQDTVTTVTPIIHIIDPTKMQLKVSVDEIDIAQVKTGQKATIDVDALPDLALSGNVSLISQLPVEEGGVIVFDVTVSFEAPEDSGLKTGMSASTDILVNERTNVLLVPSQAVTQNSNGDNVVEVSIDGKTEERKVTIGISDGFQTEIISGLSEGETVVEKR